MNNCGTDFTCRHVAIDHLYMVLASDGVYSIEGVAHCVQILTVFRHSVN